MKRIAFLRQLRMIIKSKGSDSLVYIDETGFDAQCYRDHGWGFKGQKIHGERSGKRWHRTSLLLAQRGLERFAPMLFTGTCTAVLFNAWLEKFLVPQLKAGQTVIMDNAAIHKSQRTREIIESAACQLLFLPPYSPDFNPIEKTFGFLKRKRKHMTDCGNLDKLICSII